MPHTSLQVLGFAVMVLGLSSLAVAVVVFLLMEIRYHNQLTWEARRVMLANLLIPSWDSETLRAAWSSCGRAEREILEQIVVAHQDALEPEEGRRFEQVVVNSPIFERWQAQLRKGSIDRRLAAAASLGHFHGPGGVQALVDAVEDPSPEVRLAVALSLGRLRDLGGLPGLLALCRQPGSLPDLTLAAALAACAASSPERLIPLLEAEDARARLIGAWAISEVADASVLSSLCKAARDADPEVRAKVARALSRLPDSASQETLVELTRDPVWFVRVRAFDAIGKLGAPASAEVARGGLGDPVREVRYRAATALRQIAGMECRVALQVLREGPVRNFNSLFSEWERAGFLWEAMAVLAGGGGPRFQEAREFFVALIAAGITPVLEDFVQTYPNLKVRLRLARLLAEAGSPKVCARLLTFARHSGCDRRLAAAIQRCVAGPATVPSITVRKGVAEV